MTTRWRMALLVVLVLVAAACGARFDDETGSVGSGGLAADEGGVAVGEMGVPGAVASGDLGSGAVADPTAGPVAGAPPGATVAGGAPAPGGGADPGPAPGVTATEIKVGYLLPISGAAPVPSEFDKGVNAYYDDLNAKGGLNGRKIKVVIADTESSASVGKTKAQKLIEQDKVFLVVVLDRLENQKAIGEYLDSRSVPNIQIQTPANLAKDQTWTFGVTIDHAVQGKLIADYFVKVLKATKVAVVHENTPILDPGKDAFTRQIKALGAEVTESRAIDGQSNDFSSEALALSRSGATATWLYMAPTPAAKLVNQADALNYHPTWFANSISWAFDLIFTVAPKALTGARAFSPWLPLSDPRSAAFQQAYRKYNNNANPDDLGLVGWGVGQIVVEGLRKTGPTLGQNAFREAMQHLQFKSDVFAPLAFGPGVRQGANVVTILKEQGGRWVLERDFTSTI